MHLPTMSSPCLRYGERLVPTVSHTPHTSHASHTSGMCAAHSRLSLSGGVPPSAPPPTPRILCLRHAPKLPYGSYYLNMNPSKVGRVATRENCRIHICGSCPHDGPQQRSRHRPRPPPPPHFGLFSAARNLHTSASCRSQEDQDHYQVLGVGEQADSTEIKKKFYALSKQLHPDRNPGDQEATSKFQAVSAAYSILSDASSRLVNLLLPYSSLPVATAFRTLIPMEAAIILL